MILDDFGTHDETLMPNLCGAPAGDVMKPIGELYSLPLDTEAGPPIRPFLLRHSVSLAGAKKGEYCPAGLAEIIVPRSLKRLDTEWGIFLRTKVENRPPGHNQEPEIIDAWLRV